jgi:hypothetical protein
MGIGFEELLRLRVWTPIRNCPGRYGLAQGPTTDTPEALTGRCGEEFRCAAARDVVVVVSFPTGGGLISYKRADGSYLHTLNTADGLDRKLRELKIVPGSAF